MSLWKRLWAALPRLGIALLIVGLVVFIVFIGVMYYTGMFPGWTGFGPLPLDAQGKELPHEKTLWDWLGLLLIPLVLAVGGYFLTRSENRYALSLQEQREQEASLRAYLDQMTELLLHEKLRASRPDDEVQSVARARTLTVLRVLDSERKATVLQFLYEAKLIGDFKREEDGSSETIDEVVILAEANLKGAYLEGAYLEWAHLEYAHLEGAYLKEAYLKEAHLESAYLERAHLVGAHLERTYLEYAHLEYAHLEGANLDGASLQNANLDGASLRGASLVRAYLRGASLPSANLRGANLSGAQLEGANLEGAYLRGANLQSANLRGANLQSANLSGANLSGADLTGCKVTRQRLAYAGSLEGAKLPFDMTHPPVPEIKVRMAKEQATAQEPKIPSPPMKPLEQALPVQDGGEQHLQDM